jgi:2-dehydropantoate 2-reductase
MHSGVTHSSFLVRSSEHELIQSQAFQCLLPGEKNSRVYACKAFASWEGIEKPDVVVIGVKSYSLESILDHIESAFGHQIPVVSVLNGVKHVKLLKGRFPNAIFATIVFNAYRTSPVAAVAVGGAVGLSSFSQNNKVLDDIFKILNRKISVTRVKDPLSAAHCKLVLNLGNALLTLIGFHNNRKREFDVFQKLYSEMMLEGVQVLRKKGVKEAFIPDMPPWIVIWLSNVLPGKLIQPLFEKKMQGSTINSMAQDLENGIGQTEFEDINGYFIQMADKVGLDVPYNRAIYQIFGEWIKGGGQPLKPSTVFARVNSFSVR